MARRFPAGTLIRIAILALLSPSAAAAQSGTQQRADATSQTIVANVQRAISSLPPASAQGFAWAFDPALGTWAASNRPGSTVLRTADTIGEGRINLRAAVSYFALDEEFGPINYEINAPGNPPQYTKIGSGFSAKAAVISLAGTVGLTPTIELSLTLPITVVDASGYGIFTTPNPQKPDILGFRSSIAALDQAIDSNQLFLVSAPFNEINQNVNFSEGTSAGVGRISVGGKWVAFSGDLARLALGADFNCPSPSEDEFAGSDTASFLPRAIVGVDATSWLRVLSDVGYEFDFDESELSRFTWSVGATTSLTRFSFDLGFAGSLYDTAINWTPPRFELQGDPDLAGTTFTALGDTEIGTNYVDFLFGVRVALTEALLLSGGLSVPVNDDGVRPDAVGTLAFEAYL